MAPPKVHPARGMRDFLPEDVRKREYVIGVIKKVYERYGFEPLETPAAENLETLIGKYGEEGNQLIFKILRRGIHAASGDSDLALRYDLTVPLARVFAQYHGKLPKFFKRYQIQPVWRADKPGRGRFREFYQCDVDVIGSRSMIAEAELISTQYEALKELGFNDFVVRLNHRKVLTGILHATGIPIEKHVTALIALDKLDKIGEEGVIREFEERDVLSGDAGRNLMQLFMEISFEIVNDAYNRTQIYSEYGMAASESFAMNVKILDRLERFIGRQEIGQSGIDDLKQILNFMSTSEVLSKVEISPSLARGLSYYTGAIMEIQAKDLPGSLGGGGRYDNLIGMFLGHAVPACGFSLGLERILVLMSEKSMFPPELLRDPVDVLIAVSNEHLIPTAMLIANDLRRGNSGLRVMVYPQPSDKFQKQKSYCQSRKIPILVALDENHIWINRERGVERSRIPEVVRDMLPGARAIIRSGEDLLNKGVENLREIIDDTTS